jgi:hypothetical protein
VREIKSQDVRLELPPLRGTCTRLQPPSRGSWSSFNFPAARSFLSIHAILNSVIPELGLAPGPWGLECIAKDVGDENAKRGMPWFSSAVVLQGLSTSDY